MNNKPLFTMISGGTIYSPALLGKKDMLIAAGRIALIDEQLQFPNNVQMERCGEKNRPRHVH